jgi:hypothetical protein
MEVAATDFLLHQSFRLRFELHRHPTNFAVSGFPRKIGRSVDWRSQCVILDVPRLLHRILAWPLWGVLLCGLVNVLLYERGGQIFNRQAFPFLCCLIMLPVIGGFLTRKKPLFTAVAFAIGSVPPLNDMLPMSICLWPFYWAWAHHGPWVGWFVVFPFVLVLTAVTLIAMTIPYAALVCIGWCTRCTLEGRATLEAPIM